MTYNIIDVVNKTIKLEEKKICMINDLIKENRNLPTVKLLGKVFAKESSKMILYYEGIKNEIKNEELEEVDFRTYDKISFLINEFSGKMYMPNVETPKEYLHHAFDIASDELALFIDIQGRLVNNSSSSNGITYSILSKIIARLQYQADSIKNIIKQTVTL